MDIGRSFARWETFDCISTTLMYLMRWKLRNAMTSNPSTVEEVIFSVRKVCFSMAAYHSRHTETQCPTFFSFTRASNIIY